MAQRLRVLLALAFLVSLGGAHLWEDEIEGENGSHAREPERGSGVTSLDPPPSSAPTSATSSICIAPPEAYNRYIAHMQAGWDEEISLALQDEEVNQYLEEAGLAPQPEQLPQPFAVQLNTVAAEEENNSQPTLWASPRQTQASSSNQSLAEAPAEDEDNWDGWARINRSTGMYSWVAAPGASSSSSSSWTPPGACGTHVQIEPVEGTMASSSSSSWGSPVATHYVAEQQVTAEWDTTTGTWETTASSSSASPGHTTIATEEPETTVEGVEVDWWEAIRDRRGIRQNRVPRADKGGSSDMYNHNNSPACARDPQSLLRPARGVLKPLRRWTPTTTNGSDNQPQAPKAVDSWPTWEATRSTTSQSAEEVGVTQRFGEWRTGRDRWHTPEGKVINRLRDRLQAEQAEAELPTIEEENLFVVEGVTQVNGEDVVQVTNASGDKFWVRSSTRENSTATPSSTSDEASEGTTSSSANERPSVGFWHRGVFYNRERTPQEQRSHNGGRGAQRMARKQQRAREYYQGLWKPAWLRQYAADRQERERQAATGGEVTAAVTERQAATGGEVTAAVTEAGTTNDPGQGETEELNDTEWTQDPTTGWWDRRMSTSFSSTASPPTTGFQEQWTTGADPPTWPSTTTTTSTRNLTREVLVGVTLRAAEILLSSTSTTSTSVADDFYPPNFGLFPVVSEMDDRHTWLMELTNSERARLQENGVPQGQISRIEQLLLSLDDHDSADLGPESRWGLGRLTQRLDEALGSLEAILEILLRRLRPRGHWPVTRIPTSEVMQLRMFRWAQNYGDIFQDTLRVHLHTPLQSIETASASSSRPLAPTNATTAAMTHRARGEESLTGLVELEAMVNSSQRKWEAAARRLMKQHRLRSLGVIAAGVRETVRARPL